VALQVMDSLISRTQPPECGSHSSNPVAQQIRPKKGARHEKRKQRVFEGWVVLQMCFAFEALAPFKSLKASYIGVRHGYVSTLVLLKLFAVLWLATLSFLPLSLQQWTTKYSVGCRNPRGTRAIQVLVNPTALYYYFLFVC
jgi:hypothetical protein